MAEVFSGTAGHNCGGRCVTRAVKKDGKIVRILTDESYVSPDFEDHVSNPQSRACSRCRSYVGRLYSNSRVRYPLKQTKERGNLDGFIRISWEQAMQEIASKYNAIVAKYGEEAVYNHMSSGQQGPFNRGGGNTAGSQFAARVGPLGGGYLHQGNSYSAHQSGYFGMGYTGAPKAQSAQEIAANTSTLLLWGTHCLTTSNSDSFAAIKMAEDMKKRGAKIYYINPTLEDTGITMATDWIQIKPSTDAALMSALVYEMIINTFNADGSIAASPWLDVDYLDMMVYGFFDSPAYYLEESTGDISLTEMAGYTKVEAVAPGRSYSAYIMGDDDRLTKATYGTAINGQINYMSAKFAGQVRAVKCSYITADKAASTIYYYKKDMLKAKTAKWAEGITGIPEQSIKDLAKRLSDDMLAGNAIMHHSSNGWQRQAEGVANLFALQSLAIITKSWGKMGSGVLHSANITASYDTNGANISFNTSPEAPGSKTYYSNNVPKIPSCTIWHDGVKFGFDMAKYGYTANYIPGASPDTYGKSFVGDSNVKSLIKHKLAYDDLDSKLNNNANTRYKTVSLPDKDGVARDYFDWEKDSAGKAIPVGIRFIFTMAGNAIVNQHMNANDTVEMLSKIPITAPEDGDGFCYIALDTNFSPTMRWADYALPGAANWEMVDLVGGSGGAQQIYMPAVIPPPGEAKSGYETTRLLSRYLGKVNPAKYGKLAEQFDNGLTPDDYIRKGFDTAKAADPAAYAKWATFDDYKKSGYIIRKPKIATSEPATKKLRDDFETCDITQPFIKTGSAVTTNKGDNYRTSKDNPYSGYMVDENDPKPSLRFHVFSGMLVWEYEHRNEKFHGYLPADERGNKNIDSENDPIVYPIPMYFDYRDYYRDAFGKDLYAVTDAAQKPLMALSTHQRYRSHSTFNDSPLMRELGKVRKGGGIALDTADFGRVFSSVDPSKGADAKVRRLGSVDDAKYGYERLWISPEDAAARGIADGDLVKVGNPVGYIRAVASISNRMPSGTVIVPQGGWYDPSPIDGIDDGGCVNTISPSLPSRCDHGNAQMSLLVIVSKA